MFTSVLVGVDGKQGGRDAIALAKQLAGRNARITLAHIYGAGLMPGRGAALLLAAELEGSKRLLERERDAAAPGAGLIPYPQHSVGRGLHILAERAAADVIVIGASRHGLLGRVLLGNDTVAALSGSPCAVAIAPSGYAEHAHPLAVLGVGHDGSPESERALATARQLAARSSSTVRSLPVSSPQSGPCGDELVSFGEQLDLLILGSPGCGPVGRLLHRSTSNQLARRVRCPLLVLPRSPADATETDQDVAVETTA